MWRPQYEDRGSEQFKNISSEISTAVENLYVEKNNIDNKIFVNVVQIK